MFRCFLVKQRNIKNDQSASSPKKLCRINQRFIRQFRDSDKLIPQLNLSRMHDSQKIRAADSAGLASPRLFGKQGDSWYQSNRA
jgi:hypothetical protein